MGQVTSLCEGPPAILTLQYKQCTVFSPQADPLQSELTLLHEHHPFTDVTPHGPRDGIVKSILISL